MRAAAERAGVELTERREGVPPELVADHPLLSAAIVATGRPAFAVPFGTDAVHLQRIAPSIVLGPGDVTTAHTPEERVAIAELAAAPPLLLRLAERVSALP